ncbi:hypothetical protein ATCC90586_004580 [Pythium insidiosum]|nr:hypothetical protein ATCC90586_004580 [Pythium insidiosum]
MEVRVHGLSLSTELVVPNEDAASSSSAVLPTVSNEIMSGIHALLPGKTRRVTKHILRDVNAVFRPGTMTLVLGQPGSGKSSLLKVLSGRFPLSKDVTLGGEIKYNGRSQSELQSRLPQFVSYVSQRDSHFASLTVKETLAFAHECYSHFASLTVKETLAFAHECCGSPHSHANSREEEIHTAIAPQYAPDTVIQKLGLESCQDTIVGDAMVRGVSGGERKRVTTGEMAFGNRLVACMDEISTGLDSAATFDILKAERRLARAQRKTMVIALLQPPPEVFELFDDVLILNQGMVVYYGPITQARSYFEALGFICPPHRDFASFLVDLGTNQQHQYEVPNGERSTPPPRSAREFAAAFSKSSLHGNTIDALQHPTDPALDEDEVQFHLDSTSAFNQSFWRSVWTLMKRDAKMMIRDDGLLKGRAAMVLIVGLVFSSLFYQFSPLNVQLTIGTAYASSTRLPTFLAAREVFYKQRGANFFTTAAYVLATSLTQLPLALMEVLVFGSLVYWVCGFVADAGAFLVFEMLMFVTNLAFAAWFFFISSIAPNLLVGEPMALLSVLFYILFAGFIVTKKAIPVYFVWLYWGNPMSWCLRALAINQYRSEEFAACTYKDDGINYCEQTGQPSVGEYMLSVFDIETEKAWLCSGAGKTTLMDVIAGRKTGGTIRGEVLLNGHLATDLAIRRATGYCEQMDIHSTSSTFREALAFSAFLRQSSTVSDAFKRESVEDVLDLLDLRGIADQIIRGSSVEQMKRLTIGVELAAQPSVLFLDEPTSGLDARAAKLIMDGVRKVANTGRTIVCTIHQPSAEVFQVFDSLLLLKRGGEMVYFGELGSDAMKMIEYFQALPSVEPIQPGYNPATWMLEVIGAGVRSEMEEPEEPNNLDDFVKSFQSSNEHLELKRQLKRAASNWTQATLITKRFMTLFWRLPDYNLTRLVIGVMLAIIFSLSFTSTTYDSYQGINAGLGMVFTTTMFLGAVAFESALPPTIGERPSFYRERASQTYNAFWYFVGLTLVEVPWVFGMCFLFVSVFFPIVGFTGLWRFVLYWFHTSLHVLLQVYIAQLFAFAFSSLEIAMVTGVLMNTLNFLLMGFNPPATAIPTGYKWLHHLLPAKYSFHILASLVFGDCDNSSPSEVACMPLRNLPQSVAVGTTAQQYIEQAFLIKYDDLWFNFAIVMGYMLLVRLATLVAVRFANHQKR